MANVKSIYGNIITPPNDHTHENKSVLDGISSADISNWNGKASTVSPTFTGSPEAPTVDTSDNSARIATTNFVFNKILDMLSCAGVIVLKSIKINFSWTFGSHGTVTKTCIFEYTDIQNNDITDRYTDISGCEYADLSGDEAPVRALWVGISKINKTILYVGVTDGSTTGYGQSDLPDGYDFTRVKTFSSLTTSYVGTYNLETGLITEEV